MTTENKIGVGQNPTEEMLLSYIPRNNRGEFQIGGTVFNRFYVPIEEPWRNLIGKKDIGPRIENPNIEYLYLKKPEIVGHMTEVKVVANGDRTPDNLQAVFDYCLPLGKVYKLLALEAIEQVGESAIVYAPRNGGLYVNWILEQVLRDKKVNWKFFDYRMSRIPVDCGPYGVRLGVGTIFYDYLAMIRSFDNQVLFDDCVATDISLKETSRIIQDVRGEEIERCNVKIFTSISNETTLNQLEQDIRGQRVNSVYATAGVPNFFLDEHGYLVDADGKPDVSDMGKWTKDFMKIRDLLKKALF